MKQLSVETAEKRLTCFERYLSLWVAACMLVGVLTGKLLPGLVDALRRFEFGAGSQINVPIAVLMVDDHPDDDEGRLHLDPERGAKA